MTMQINMEYAKNITKLCMIYKICFEKFMNIIPLCGKICYTNPVLRVKMMARERRFLFTVRIFL